MKLNTRIKIPTNLCIARKSPIGSIIRSILIVPSHVKHLFNISKIINDMLKSSKTPAIRATITAAFESLY
jgi:hypothetical protein